MVKNKFSKRKNVIDANYKIINPENDEQISSFKENKSKENSNKLSLKNKNFVLLLYLTLISMITMMIYLALK